MTKHISKDPLHGITLEMQVNTLVEKYGWKKLSQLIKINCFKSDPSVKSSLKFLRRTPWARAEVENLYLDSLEDNMNLEKEDIDVFIDDPWANSKNKKY
ncbi:VF530 family DNA-binding protein [Proteus myxofaciens]|nr:VF530 family protein [Proteus myxofaciens]